MSMLSSLIVGIGLLLLAHAGYSTHEHSTLYGSVHSLPADIALETLVSVILVTAGLVMGTEKLRPISWSAWAGEIEKNGGVENPFRGLEERIGFLDIRDKRKEFADWIRAEKDVPAKE
ncbi:hypothetical protein FQN49_008132 [Arthroderma sp. PD_2]|nr:hypothetical protein FQN49_008132 [Arthroderma sp. PD_2]